MPNVVYAMRISDDRDTSTSIQAQQEELDERKAEREARGETINVVYRIKDETVSGDIDPTKRPALGVWLTPESREQWDEIWVTTQDRLSRNDMHSMAFIFKMIEWSKVLVILDDPTLNMHTIDGRQAIYNRAAAAAKELERIRSRVKKSHIKRKMTPAWTGGVPPYGYKTADAYDDEGKKRRHLVLNEHQTEVLHEVWDWLVNHGENLHGAAKRLNDRNELTVSDAWRVAHGKKFHKKKNSDKAEPWTPTERWSASGLRRTLVNVINIGIKRSQGKPIHERDGTPLKVVDPAVFTQNEWDELQAVLEQRRKEPKRRHGTSPLLGIAFCGKCFGPAYRVVITKPSGTYSYYRCARGSIGGEKRCPVNITAKRAEELVTETFLREHGDSEVVELRYVPGTDSQKELDEVDRKISRLREDRENGAYDNDSKYYAERMKELTAQRNRLSEIPRIEAHWEEVGQGYSYAEGLAKANDDEKRKMLVDAGLRLYVMNGNAPDSIFETNVPRRDKPTIVAYKDSAVWGTVVADVEPA